jgi:hypothetical protein
MGHLFARNDSQPILPVSSLHMVKVQLHTSTKSAEGEKQDV